jgi:hypothetical protein
MLESYFVSRNNASDIDAIAAYLNSTPARTPEAQAVKNKFNSWFENYSRSIFKLVATDESFHTATNFRDEFNKANAVTVAQEQAVRNVKEYGLQRNEMYGLPPGTVDLWTRTKQVTKWVGIGVAVAGAGYMALQLKPILALIKTHSRRII